MFNFSYEIRTRLTAREVLELYGFDVDRVGFTHCPFHQGDNTGSLKVYDSNKGWHCFGCGAGTSVIDFVMKYFGLSFYDAEKKLNEDFRLGLPIGDRLSDKERSDAQRKAAERKRIQEERNRKHEELLTAYNTALDLWIWLDKMKRENAPKSPQDGFCESYVFAVSWIDAVGAELDEATDRLMEFERSKRTTDG